MKGTERSTEEPHACCRHGDKPSGLLSRRFIVWHTVIGLLSLVWFVLRVAPKPSRIRYPCQRVAAPLASGFLLYLGGMVSSILAYKKYQLLIRKMSRRAAIGSLCLAGIAMVAYFGIRVASVLGISDPVHEHSPVGPGSPAVVSVYDENVSKWGGESDYWNHVNQGVVNTMMARAVTALTGTALTDEAWANILPDYSPGQTIAIKVNFNNNDALNFNSVPQPVVALVNQLKQFGFAESEIFVYDTSRRIGSADTNSIQYFFRDTIETAFPEVTIIDNTTSNRWSSNQFTTYSTIDGYVSTPYAKILDDADYLINVPIMRAHPISGVTFGLKNHYGSIQQIVFGGGVVPLHDGIRQAHSGYVETGVPLVELNALEAIDDKTVLVVGDGIYSHSSTNTSPPNRNPEVIFMSKDAVALDSVIFDFFHTLSPRQVWHQNYLHLAAEAGLGVHDHYPYSQINYIELTEDTDVFTLLVDIVGSGSVSRDPAPPYYPDDVVTLTADPEVGWSFAGWSGDASGSANPLSLTMDADKNVTAMFTQDEYTLTVNVVGLGTVDLNPAGPYHLGDVVTLTAAPEAGWSFNSWSGDAAGSTSPTSITISGHKTVTATFAEHDSTPPTDPVIGTQPQVLNEDAFAVVLSVPSTDPNFSGYQVLGGQYSDWTDTVETGPFLFTLVQDTENTLNIRGQDTYGNVSNAASVVVTEDSQLPTEPLIEAASDVTDADSVTVTIATASIDEHFSNYQIAGGQYAGWTDTAETASLEFTLLQNAENTLQVRGVDAAGNAGPSASVVVVEDSSDPTQPVLEAASQAVNADTFTVGLAVPSTDANFECYQLRGGQYSDWTDTATGDDFVFYLTQNAENVLEVRGKDVAGHMSAVASVTITEDSVAPDAPGQPEHTQ